MRLRTPWILTSVTGWLKYLDLASALRIHAFWERDGRGENRDGTLKIRVRRPFRGEVVLRERGTDFGTFREVAVQEIYRTVAERAGECDYALDLGGNIGLTSLYLADRFPRCRLLTVEPSPENLAILALNLGPLIAAGRCQICRGAAWGSDTDLALKPLPDATAFDAIQVGEAGARGPDATVAAFTVASLIEMAGFPRVDILKIDVEGAEVAIFRGPTQWLSRVNAVAIEFHGESRRESGFDRVMAESGFLIEDDRSPGCVVAYRPRGSRVPAGT